MFECLGNSQGSNYVSGQLVLLNYMSSGCVYRMVLRWHSESGCETRTGSRISIFRLAQRSDIPMFRVIIRENKQKILCCPYIIEQSF